MKRVSIFMCMAIFFGFLAAASDAATVDVSMEGSLLFVPGTVTINVGDTVRWTNNDGFSPHTSTSGAGCTSNGIWSSPLLSRNQTFSRTFDSPGTFPYFCSVLNHCAFGMRGTVIVSAATVPVPAGQDAFPQYDPVVLPELDPNPSLMKPVGVGSVATGGDDLEIRVETGNFENAVDIYLAISAPAIVPDLYLLTPTGLQPFTGILVPWKAGVAGVSESPFGSIPVSLLPPATYNLFLAVTPAGGISTFY